MQIPTHPLSLPTASSWRRKGSAFAIFLLIAGITLLWRYGAMRWKSATRSLLDKLEAGQRPSLRAGFDPAELVGLPAPVQRFFRAVLKPGQPVIGDAFIEHAGTFNAAETGEQWSRFHSTQRVVTLRPGFVWDARIAMIPGIPVHVHDAYVAGEGVLHAALLGLLPLAEMRGTPSMAEGELMRFLAETAWYPTALLPSQGVRWEAVDGSSARATLADESTEVTLLFRFHDAGPIASVRAEARGRAVDGRIVPTPWEGRWSSYEVRNDILIPLEGEVSWLLPEGPKPYWRGRITTIRYGFPS